LLLDVMLVPLIVFWAIGHQQYLLTAMFGALLALLADPEAASGSECHTLASIRSSARG